MQDIFSQARLRPWVKLRNPTAFYNTGHIAIWELESTGNEELVALLGEEMEFMLRVV